MGLRGITAGDWIKDKLIHDFGMKADSFGFSYDKELYFPQKKTGHTKRVFFMRALLLQEEILKLAY